MNTINKVQLIGELKNTPELSVVNGLKIARFVVSTCDYYRVNGSMIMEHQWHNVVAMGQQASLVAQNFSKGDELILEGSIVRRKVSNGHKDAFTLTEVLVKNVLLPFAHRA
ncbi:MAG: single-stranded DNA-binding protein [Bacteroidales bacterium]|nr:single-stranded DNA-binding protein [Bacteroidales bacterium]